jgi:hypothetical protein
MPQLPPILQGRVPSRLSALFDPGRVGIPQNPLERLLALFRR